MTTEAWIFCAEETILATDAEVSYLCIILGIIQNQLQMQEKPSVEEGIAHVKSQCSFLLAPGVGLLSLGPGAVCPFALAAIRCSLV